MSGQELIDLIVEQCEREKVPPTDAAIINRLRAEKEGLMSEFDRLKAQKDAISERDGLRNEQARRVMPLIGGLIDAWDGMYADDAMELEEMYPSLVRAIKAIRSAQIGELNI